MTHSHIPTCFLFSHFVMCRSHEFVTKKLMTLCIPGCTPAFSSCTRAYNLQRIKSQMLLKINLTVLFFPPPPLSPNPSCIMISLYTGWPNRYTMKSLVEKHVLLVVLMRISMHGWYNVWQLWIYALHPHHSPSYPTQIRRKNIRSNSV